MCVRGNITGRGSSRVRINVRNNSRGRNSSGALGSSWDGVVV